MKLVYRQAGGWVSPVVLIDGRAAGVWDLAREKDRVEIAVQPFGRLGPSQQQKLGGEAERLGAFLQAPVESSIVRTTA